MGSQNIRDLLTSFSPSLDFFAISSGDGRIKIWDTLKGQVQTEFADIISADATDIYTKSERGHLSVDYTCMKWLSPGRKRKRKLGSSLLVLGTGSGDVLALDVSAGQLKWRVSDCNPGGVNDISFSTHGSCIYTAGVDGMVCQIDSMTGSLSGKFRASTKAIASMSISSDGKILAIAASQLKIFDCSDNKKIQKFSGHPGAVRCLIFTEDGKFILSSAVGERYVALWRVDSSKKKSASCVLAMDHPAVFLDSKCIDNVGTDDVGLYILAISELGLCYFWYGRNIDELRNSKPTKISMSLEDHLSKNKRGGLPTIFAAKLQGIVKPASGHMFVAYGSLIKPSFEKILVQRGIDIKLCSFHDGVLLPVDQSHKSKKGQSVQTGVTSLNRANAEDALLPITKLYDFHDNNRRLQNSKIDLDEVLDDDLVGSRSHAKPVDCKDDLEKLEGGTVAVCMEDRLRSLGILSNGDDLTSTSTLTSKIFSDAHFEANIPQKKMNSTISSMTPSDAYKLLTVLVAMWQSRSHSGKHVLPWICSILVNHSRYVVSQEPASQMLDILYKMTESKGVSIQSLLHLSGRLQLITAQIDRASQNKNQTLAHDNQLEESEDGEDVDELVYGEDSESQSGSDDDN
ncbi:hypothetical protein HHK36_026423 [Tetracentron sinense]|uniref:Small-subunit processome Utp12 domain-containing protein n=1 Tax=Tetracentron sinense TaxID=13715 RepID=A0A835D273_TETSI|nr:hypothetical protein HHK36_026423 [Tetracentron sinense]